MNEIPSTHEIPIPEGLEQRLSALVDRLEAEERGRTSELASASQASRASTRPLTRRASIAAAAFAIAAVFVAVAILVIAPQVKERRELTRYEGSYTLRDGQHIPAHKNPSTRNPKRRTLRHRQNLNSSPFQALATLVEQGLLEPLETQSPSPPFGPNYDPTKHCAYHQISGHETDHCIRLQYDIQKLIDEGVF